MKICTEVPKTFIRALVPCLLPMLPSEAAIEASLLGHSSDTYLLHS